VKKLVAQHDENIQMLVDTSDTYKLVLNLSLLAVIANLLNSLLVVKEENWAWLLLIAPLVFFEVLIYCYSCQMIKTVSFDSISIETFLNILCSK
jgi:hypothetical protein